MTLSPPISDRSHPLRARWLAARNDRTCNELFDSQVIANAPTATSFGRSYRPGRYFTDEQDTLSWVAHVPKAVQRRCGHQGEAQGGPMKPR